MQRAASARFKLAWFSAEELQRGSAEELERLVSQHMDNPKMWASESLNTRRATKQDREAFAEGLDRAIADNFAAE